MAVIVALHGPVPLTTRASVAGTVIELGDPVDPYGGVPTDGRLSGAGDFDPSAASADAVPAVKKMYGLELSRDSAAGISLIVNGVAVTFDSVVARSYLIELVTNEGSMEGDLPANGEDKDLAMPGRSTTRTSSTFNEQIKSVSDNRIMSSDSNPLNEWDSRDFQAPQWVAQLRDVVRDDSPAERESGTPHPDAIDSKTWIKQAVRFFTSVQTQFSSIDPLIVALLGIAIFPFVLVGLALSPGNRNLPSSAVRKSKKTRRRTSSRSRRQRDPTKSIRIKTRIQN